MENEITNLPAEIQEQALQVSDEKQKEVINVLTDIFKGTSEWEKQVDAIVVKDVNDKMSIDMAETARKNAKNARIAGAKAIKEKREEVQFRMSDDKLEDALWLKSGQIMELKFKHIEEKAKYKSEFVKRYEAEQLQLRNDLRYQKVLKYVPDEEISILGIGQMPNDVFDVYLSGLERSYFEKIEAEQLVEKQRVEAEKLKALREERSTLLKNLWQFVPEKHPEFETLSSDEWNDFLAEMNNAKESHDKKQEAIRKENERLKKEAAKKELQNNKRNDELRPYIVFIRDYNGLLNKEEKEYQKEFTDIKKGAELQWEHDRKEMKEKAEQEEKLREQKLKLEARIKKDAAAKEAERVRIINEEIAEKNKEKAAKLAPDKEKLIILANQIEAFKLPTLTSDEANKILRNVKILLAKTKVYINENINKI